MDSTIYNNTFTSATEVSPSSAIYVFEESQGKIIDSPKEVLVTTVLDLGYLYSIELKRSGIKKQLAPYFECEGINDEIDFLASNNDLLRILPSIGSYLFSKLNNGDRISLELLNEDENWQTLFINIYSSLSWDQANDLIEKTLDTLLELFPKIAPKLNFNFIPS